MKWKTDCLIGLLETYQAMLWYLSESIIFKNSKIALLEYFSTGTKIVENHSKFYLSLMKTSGKHSVHFWLVSLHGAINHSGTPLILKLRSPLSTKGSFVLSRLAHWTLRGDKAQTDYINIILEIRLWQDIFSTWNFIKVSSSVQFRERSDLS